MKPLASFHVEALAQILTVHVAEGQAEVDPVCDADLRSAEQPLHVAVVKRFVPFITFVSNITDFIKNIFVLTIKGFKNSPLF